jgi:hypothetical protein
VIEGLLLSAPGGDAAARASALVEEHRAQAVLA